MLWRHAWVFLDNHIADRFYQDKFYLPYFNWYPLPSEGFYLFLLCVIILCGLFLIIGYQSKQAAIVAFCFVFFHLMLNQIWYRHNRYFFVLLLLLLAVGPGHKIFSTENKFSPTGSIWSYWMIRLQMTLTYLASAIAKTLDPDWRSGYVLKGRIDRLFRGNNMGGENLPVEFSDWFEQLVRSDTMAVILTLLALGQEYFLAIGLWIPKVRKLAIWVGLVFHGSIEFSSYVLVFSYASLATYFVVIRPTMYDRQMLINPENPAHLKMARLIHALDWLRKISILKTDTEKMVIIDKDGCAYSGPMALIIAGCCLVLPYGIAYPFSWFKHFGVGRVEPPMIGNTEPFNLGTSGTIKKVFVPVMIVLFLIYQALMVLMANRLISWDLQDLSPLDAVLIIFLFYVVSANYQEKVKR